MKIESIYETKRKTNSLPEFSFEIFPPKYDDSLKSIDETLGILASLNPDFISVTFGAGGSANNNKTIALAKKIKTEYGIEPLVHLTCLTYTKSEIDSFLVEMENAGIENILALRGDEREGVEAKNDFPHASDLAKYIKSKNSGFCLGGACYPEKHPQSADLVEDTKALKAKADSGVSFFVSQLFFDNSNFFKFKERCALADVNLPVSAGIMPAINKKQIERMVNMCGATLPDIVCRFLNKYGDNKDALLDAGLAYSINQIIDLASANVDGIHLYTMNNPVIAKRIADGIRNFIR